MSQSVLEKVSSSFDLVHWLRTERLFPKIYWKEKGSKRAIAAMGASKIVSQVPMPIGHERYFGGLCFFEKRKEDILWKNFPQCQFILPTAAIEQEDPALKPIQFPRLPPFLERIDTPDQHEWEKSVSKALNRIKNKELEKIVLARRTTLIFQEDIDPFQILSLLLEKSSEATVFLYQLSDDEAFIGASPERLYKREGRMIYSDVLAGTRPRGKTVEEDNILREELRTSDKDKREFLFVKDFLSSTLSPLCEKLSYDKDMEILTTANVQHLYQQIKGFLKKGVSDQMLLHALHPTPALGGCPRGRALQHLFDEEPFGRGWYGSPLGWIGSEDADMAVAIRSALVQKNKLHVFAGVGVVEGSDPIKEWEELDHKIKRFTFQ